MLRILVLLCCAALAVAGCSSGDKKSSETPAGATTTTTATGSVASSSTTTIPAATTTTTTLELPTTSLPCRPLPIPTTPVTSPASRASVLLTKVQEINDACVDHVVFDFTAKSPDPPGYSITYGTPPFQAAGSGATVPVTGNAFIVVTVKPGYGYDYEQGKPSYTGPKAISVAGANHVQQIVETGDYEGTLTWVIGLDQKRAFSVQATGAPQRQLVVSVS